MMTSDLPLSLLLHRVGEELQAQADAVRALHDLVTQGPAATNAAIGQAQAIDVSSQHLDAIAALLSRVADHLPERAAVPTAVLDPIVLSALRDRLAGTYQPAAESGDVDFF